MLSRVGGQTLNGATALAALPSISTVRGVAYRMEVHEPDGTLLAWIPEWYGGQRWARLLEPETLQFNVPADSVAAEYLVYPNEIHLMRGDYDTPVQMFAVLAVTRGAAAHTWVQVEAQSLLGQLGRERGVSYATTAATAVSDVLAEVLALQVNDEPIGLGRVDKAIGEVEIEIATESTSLLDVLRKVREAVGGYYWVDTSRRLHWRVTQGLNRGDWIRFAHNARQIRQRTDASELATRMVGYGYGVTPDERLVSTQNDAAAQAVYGVVTSSFHESGIRDQELLDLVTARRLARVSHPRTSLHVEAIDLGQSKGVLDYSFAEHVIAPGNVVRLLCDAPELDISTMVRTVTWDLEYPMEVQLTVTDPDADDDAEAFDSDDVEVIADILERLRALERDTGVLESLRDHLGFDDLTDLLHWDGGDLGDAIEELLPTDEDLREELWEQLLGDLDLVPDGDTDTIGEQLVDGLIDNGLVGALEDEGFTGGGGGGTPSDDDPEPVHNTTAAAGTSGDYARADHVHVGTEHYQATTKAGLATTGVTDGALGYATTDKKLFARVDGAWMCLTHAETPT